MLPAPIPTEAVLIVNAHSRNGEDLFAAARSGLERAEVRLSAAHAVRDPRKLNATVRSAVAGGAEMVIVGGGDGSLSRVVGELVGTDCVFAILPLGTANSFARTIGLPLDLAGAIGAIASGRRRRIDLGMIEGHYFLNAAALGLPPMIGDTVPHKLKRYLGRIGYLVWAIWCFLRFSPFFIIVEDGDGREHRMWASEVRIFNGRFHGGVELNESTDVDSGDIVIQIVSGRSKASLAWDWYAKFFKLRSRDDTSVEIRGKNLKLGTRPRHRISIDGEILARTPVTIKVAEQAIEVAVSADVEEAS